MSDAANLCRSCREARANLFIASGCVAINKNGEDQRASVGSYESDLSRNNNCPRCSKTRRDVTNNVPSQSRLSDTYSNSSSPDIVKEPMTSFDVIVTSLKKQPVGDVEKHESSRPGSPGSPKTSAANGQLVELSGFDERKQMEVDGKRETEEEERKEKMVAPNQRVLSSIARRSIQIKLQVKSAGKKFVRKVSTKKNQVQTEQLS